MTTVEQALADALADLLEDTQHANHNCGDTEENCCVLRAERALSEYEARTARRAEMSVGL